MSIREEVQSYWKAIDKIVGHPISQKNKVRYDLLKSKLIEQSYVIRSLLGESTSVIKQSAFNETPTKRVQHAENILRSISRKNKKVAENIVYGNSLIKKEALLESMLVGDSILNSLSNSSSFNKSLGLKISTTTFSTLAKALLQLE
jgi:hypothetical protein